MTALHSYLADMRRIRASGAATPETTYHEALQALLNGLGVKLRPKVFCIGPLHDQGAGLPDFGLFTANQLRRAQPRDPVPDQLPAPDQLPERGVIEVKGFASDVREVAGSDQVSDYWERYGLVLVTNYRDFLLVGRDQFGRRVNLEHFRLADSADAFWALEVGPGRQDQALARRFEEFVTRILLHNAPLAQPKDVAWFLASYARDALARIEAAGDFQPLEMLRAALEEALGMTFEGERGRHFFHSTLVQTLFYGLFSAWVLWCKQHPDDKEARKGFDHRGAHWHLRLPVLRTLFEQVNSPGKLGPLRLDELMEWAASTLRRVDDKAFFTHFREDQAVPYFYEPFLAAFDPALRKQLGVWYTPSEVVDYMVERVDSVLREELGVADGLADRNVLVLDPCCGTGSYLVAVLKRIEKTLRDKGEEALVGADVKAAALERVFGFELRPTPLVVAHLQLSLYLAELGVELGTRFEAGTERFERPAVYLSNALTGWLPPAEGRHFLPLPELQDEADAAGRVKEQEPILVVLGNPPYNGYADVGVAEERELTEAYRATKQVRAPEGQGLNDLYVRFFRMAERHIVEGTGKGVVCLISNYSWLDGLSFTGMRERYLEAFDAIWIDCLNGDKYRTGKRTPEGEPDPSIFSTEHNREGIQVGTAITLLLRRGDHSEADRVRFRNLWGKEKRAELVASAVQDGAALYRELEPPLSLGLPFLPARVDPGYFDWPLLPELFPVSFPGVKTSRDQALVDIDRWRLERRMEFYFDPEIDDEAMGRMAPVLMTDAAGFDAEAVREELQRRGFLRQNIVRFHYRPFDLRWLYWEPETKLLDRNRAEYVPHVSEGNRWLVAVHKARRERNKPQIISRLASLHLMERGSNNFPLYLNRLAGMEAEAEDRPADDPNLTKRALGYCGACGIEAADLFHHGAAVMHAPAYQDDNESALRQDWPRIPLPAAGEGLVESAALGREIAALLDTESPVEGVTVGAIRPELKVIGAVSRVGGGSLSGEHLRLAARWGYAGQHGVTMPGTGRAAARPYHIVERAAVGAHAGVLGADTFDVHLNDVAFWCNVPERVWGYTIGGYQVIKKWLSYREHELLGRALTTEEAREVMNMARRIAALLLLEPALDENYAAVRAAARPWSEIAGS